MKHVSLFFALAHAMVKRTSSLKVRFRGFIEHAIQSGSLSASWVFVKIPYESLKLTYDLRFG